MFALGIMFVPASFWHHSVEYASYSGFDRNLIHVDPVGGGSAEGVIEVARASVQMVAVPGAHPTVDLISSDMDFVVRMDVQVLRNDSNAVPLTLKIWSPREAASYSLEFGPPPSNDVRARVEHDGQATDLGVLGNYSTGVRYHVDVAMSRIDGRLSVALHSAEISPASNAVSLVGGPSEPGYTELRSDYAPVSAGHEYAFGATTRLVRGADSYKIVLDWFDRNKQKIAAAGDWRPVSELNGWTPRNFSATAPAGATYARMNLGAGNGRTQLLMTNLFIRDSASPTSNLISNADFQNGMKGWAVVGASTSQQPPRIQALTIIPIQTSLTADAAPSLFYRLPVAVTIRSDSAAGLSSIVLENYRLAIPAQVLPVDRVTDDRAALAAKVLLIGGSLLCLWWLIPTISPILSSGRGGPKLISRYLISFSGSILRVRRVFLILAVAYIVGNAVFFGIGSGTYDMAGQKVWSYVGAYYGPAELYFLPSSVTPSEVWGGLPYAGVTFPYGPIMTWFFAALGWIYKFLVVGPGGPEISGSGLTSLIKAVNVSFGLIDGFLIYRILRDSGTAHGKSLIAAGLFVLNPAVWFLMSIWGETQTVTLFLLLAAVWAAQRERATLAWIFIIVAALARPQLVVPAFILGLLLLLWFRPLANLRALAWTSVIVGIVLAPLMFALGPALPGNYLLGIVHSQAAVDPKASQYNYVSFDGYNLWPFVSGFVSGQVGKARMFFPESSQLFAGLTYKNMANIAFASLLGLVLLWTVYKGRAARTGGAFIPILALATLALLMLETGISAQHFVIALALVAMSISSVKARFYYLLVIALSITTFVSMYGSLGFALSYPGASALAPAMYGGTNPLTRFFMAQFDSDRFMTVAIAGNLVVLLAMAVASVFGIKPSDRDHVRAVPISNVGESAARGELSSSATATSTLQ